MTATLNGVTVTRAQVQVPAWGVWWADVEVDSPEPLTGSVTLAIADVEMVGTVQSGGALHGRGRYRISGGKGSWGKSIPRLAYHNDAGVKASTVLNDAARACGEELSGATNDRLGPHYVRREGAASLALNDIAPRNWYVDLDGITYIGQRVSTAYTGEATRVNPDPASSIIELATESLSGLVPGAVVDGVTAVDVEVTLDEKRLTARVYGDVTQSSRRVSALAQLVQQLFPDIRYRGVSEFRVVSQDGDRLNLQPVRASLGLPDLSRVAMRPGVAGSRNNVTDGTLVLVAFVNANPSRPVVVNFDSPDNPGWIPQTVEFNTESVALLMTSDAFSVTSSGSSGITASDISLDAGSTLTMGSAGVDVEGTAINLGASAALAAARMTDAVIAGPFAGTITAGSTKTKIE